MKPRIVFTCVFALLFILISLPGHAMVPVTCFDHEFVRGKGKPFTESYTFPGIAGPATIQLTNNKISSATVSVNGEVVFGPSDFNQNVESLEATVTLNEGNNNVIDVTLKSKPGGTIRVAIEQEAEGESATTLTTRVLSDALRRGDISRALSLFEDSEKNKHEIILNNLGTDGISKLGETLQNAQPVYVGESYAEYQGTIIFPSGEKIIGKFTLVKTPEGWKFNAL